MTQAGTLVLRFGGLADLRRHFYHRGMSREVSVHLLPDLVEPADLRGGTAVVIDVLRASTTIVHALAAGAVAVVPCEDIDAARALAADYSAGTCLLGGERGGVRIEGFDLDNSPLAYTPERVADRTIVFTTTNGTRALSRARSAQRILIGAYVNQQAIVDVLSEQPGPVHLVCAGTRGAITGEDVLFAGAVASGLEEHNLQPGNEAARIAAGFFRWHRASRRSLLDGLRDSIGGRNLIAGGFEADIRRSAETNRFDVVPRFHSGENRITLIS